MRVKRVVAVKLEIKMCSLDKKRVSGYVCVRENLGNEGEEARRFNGISEIPNGSYL